MSAARIIVTRPQPDADAFAALLREAGAEPVLSPAMEIAFLDAPIDLAGVGAIALTSANGARALGRLAADAAPPVYAVGEATAAAARAGGLAVAGYAAGELTSLADLIGNAAVSGRFKGCVLHATGADRAGDLVEALAGRGVPTRAATLYEARPAARLTSAALAALRAEPPVEWAAFFSPRSARLFLDLARHEGVTDRLDRVGALCLSAAVADAAGTARWREIAVASARSAEAMAMLIGSRGARALSR